MPPETRTVSGDRGETLSTVKNLWPYMWPSDRPDLKRRVVIAGLFLVAAKLLTVGVPYFYKWATDALDGSNTAHDWLPLILAGAVTLVVAASRHRVKDHRRIRPERFRRQARAGLPRHGARSHPGNKYRGANRTG